MFKQIRKLTGKNAETQLSREDFNKIQQWILEQGTETVEKLVKDEMGKPNKQTPLWVLNIVSAINFDIRYGRTSTLDKILERLYGKPVQPIESDISAEINGGNNLSALTTEELLQYNELLEKIRNGSK